LIPTLKIGGSERVVTLLANEFASRSNLETHVIVYGNDVPSVYELAENVTVHRPAFKFDNRFRFFSTLRRLIYLRRTIQNGRYDAVLSFGDLWNNFVMLACFGLNAQVFLSDRSSPELEIGWLQKRLRRLLYPRAAGLLAQTSRARDVARRRGLNDRICVVPNPVILQQVAAESGRENTILSVGRMVATKHHDQLIKIFSSLNADDWKLIIVGDDDQGQKLRLYLSSLARRLGVSDRVDFPGERSDVQAFYDRAKIFAFTSSSEGFPNAVAEALASGLPVISYDCVAGPSDLIKSGENGYLVGLFDEAAFCKHLGELMVDEKKRIQMSVKARESVASLSVERVASRVLEFILD
jgi:GalNAc-alpha-(1->4)-GalNAc-alpha-(1->3)-diNAcBac-PP-undecaprenol alpha-1,4-N-acetyl-D-galactosaminyltransferase